jgi:hypothetical protein
LVLFGVAACGGGSTSTEQADTRNSERNNAAALVTQILVSPSQ